MECGICKRTESEVKLFDGITLKKIIPVCEECAEDHKIPLIKKPLPEQLEKADEYHSVRERMERLSGTGNRSTISEEMSRQALFAKLRTRPKKETNEKVADNYDWNLSMKRRRLKLSLVQLSEKTGIPKEILYSIERGRLPENFEQIFAKLEDVLGITMLKERPASVQFKRKGPSEKEILEMVKRKMENREDEDEGQKNPEKEKISLNDLIERKRKEELKKAKKESAEKEDSLLGDDLEIEEV